MAGSACCRSPRAPGPPSFDPLTVGDLKPIVDVLGHATPLEFFHNARFERRILAAMRIVFDGVFEALEATRRFYRSASAGIWA